MPALNNPNERGCNRPNPIEIEMKDIFSQKQTKTTKRKSLSGNPSVQISAFDFLLCPEIEAKRWRQKNILKLSSIPKGLRNNHGLLSRRDIPKIAQRFNAGSRARIFPEVPPGRPKHMPLASTKSRIPKGFRNEAQGCDEGAFAKRTACLLFWFPLGKRHEEHTTLKGLRHRPNTNPTPQTNSATTPLGLTMRCQGSSYVATLGCIAQSRWD